MAGLHGLGGPALRTGRAIYKVKFKTVERLCELKQPVANRMFLVLIVRKAQV